MRRSWLGRLSGRVTGAVDRARARSVSPRPSSAPRSNASPCPDTGCADSNRDQATETQSITDAATDEASTDAATNEASTDAATNEASTDAATGRCPRNTSFCEIFDVESLSKYTFSPGLSLSPKALNITRAVATRIPTRDTPERDQHQRTSRESACSEARLFFPLARIFANCGLH